MGSELFYSCRENNNGNGEKMRKCCQVWQRTERANFSVFRTFRNILAIKYILFLSRKL